jgi:hypothetical protein
MAQGGRYSAGFWSGFASSALSPLIGSARSFEGKVAMSAIVGGTASALGGGKFANGAVSAAFVMMYNEWAHDRQALVVDRAKRILQTSSISQKIKNRLHYLLSRNKVLYVDSYDKPSAGWKDGIYRGWSRHGVIALTSALWNSDGTVNEYQLTETMLHEMTHQIWSGPSQNHPAGFREFYRQQTENYYSSGDNALDLF